MKLSVIPQTTNQSAIDYVRDLLARCESGEVVAVTVMEELAGGFTSIRATNVTSRWSTAGALLDAAIMRLDTGGGKENI